METIITFPVLISYPPNEPLLWLIPTALNIERLNKPEREGNARITNKEIGAYRPPALASSELRLDNAVLATFRQPFGRRRVPMWGCVFPVEFIPKSEGIALAKARLSKRWIGER